MAKYVDETVVEYDERTGEWIIYLRGNEVWSERLKSEAVNEARKIAKGEAREIPADQLLIIKNKEGKTTQEKLYETKL